MWPIIMLMLSLFRANYLKTMLFLSCSRNVRVIGIFAVLGSSTRIAILFVPFSARLILRLAICVIIVTLPMSWKRDVKWFHYYIPALRSTSLILSDSRCCRLKVLRYRSSNCWMISTIRSTMPYHDTTSTRYYRFIVSSGRDQECPYHLLIHSLTHSFTHSLIYSLIHSFIHSLIHSFTHSFTHSFAHSLTHSLTHLLINSLIHSFIYSLVH